MVFFIFFHNKKQTVKKLFPTYTFLIHSWECKWESVQWLYSREMMYVCGYSLQQPKWQATGHVVYSYEGRRGNCWKEWGRGSSLSTKLFFKMYWQVKKARWKTECLKYHSLNNPIKFYFSIKIRVKGKKFHFLKGQRGQITTRSYEWVKLNLCQNIHPKGWRQIQVLWNLKLP